jgi:hypothetical protein
MWGWVVIAFRQCWQIILTIPAFIMAFPAMLKSAYWIGRIKERFFNKDKNNGNSNDSKNS